MLQVGKKKSVYLMEGAGKPEIKGSIIKNIASRLFGSGSNIKAVSKAKIKSAILGVRG